MNKYFQGTGQILKLIFRQDRFKMTVWLLCLIAITVTVAYAYPDVYKTERDITGFVLTMQNPAMEAMLGPVYDADTRLVAAIFAHEMLLFTAIAVAIMNILLIGRSTRTDEEDGRLELLQSLPVGRLSHITAVMLEAVILNLILVIFIGTGLSAVGLEGMTVEASFLYGSILGSAGFFFHPSPRCSPNWQKLRGDNRLIFCRINCFLILSGLSEMSRAKLSPSFRRWDGQCGAECLLTTNGGRS